MGLCSNRHFLLTICCLQIITTVERQVFDFLGYMWVPILINFFNIIFVILGFFGAFQYRPKYILSYCVWNGLWLGWNVFLTCFYLNVGILNKNSDLLNLGTGSFSWWLVNGPGCKPYYNGTIPDRPDLYRPDWVTGCVVDYEVVEVLHAVIQCALAVIAIIGGLFLARLFTEEDDSFDFVGGGDFGQAGHTALHPMYVSYSALPPAKHDSYYYPTNTITTTTSDRSSSLVRAAPQQQPKATVTIRNNGHTVDYADYSSPIDQLPPQREDYDTLEVHTPNLGANRHRYRQPLPLPTQQLVTHSPLMRNRQFARNAQNTGSGNRQNRNSFRPRVYADHIREQQPPPLPPPLRVNLRSFHSDPRLAIDEENVVNHENMRNEPRVRAARRDNRPMSMFVNNY
ncbi:sodium/potassium-transporting ATPase subunit beta-1-interacting protein isoform X3 [Phymastichus coffea]|uniref:sodium/potassium-transporting ATPase subunit beta-1-interacting protein isoform X3 n=1 Tax=Phymastichus coffea TaxID=108790 RepID=UPI00273AB96D|nr:sodium/potassium-transporting ATPase subunit beta-1-interacting protein isoform X3 [Phymastichus coffea]